jgi:hypothetical protein
MGRSREIKKPAQLSPEKKRARLKRRYFPTIVAGYGRLFLWGRAAAP